MKNLTAYNECNEREIEMMVGKAMCAYANWQEWLERTDVDDEIRAIVSAMCESEYEATIRCIDMFVRESIYGIQHVIKSNCIYELGI